MNPNEIEHDLCIDCYKNVIMAGEDYCEDCMCKREHILCHICEERESIMLCVECGGEICGSEDCLHPDYNGLCQICFEDIQSAIEGATDTIISCRATLERHAKKEVSYE